MLILPRATLGRGMRRTTGRRSLKKSPIHIVIWLPAKFYAAVAATLAEMFELVNTLRREQILSFEFVAADRQATASSGVSFKAIAKPSRRIDVLIMLAVPGL